MPSLRIVYLIGPVPFCINCALPPLPQTESGSHYAMGDIKTFAKSMVGWAERCRPQLIKAISELSDRTLLQFFHWEPITNELVHDRCQKPSHPRITSFVRRNVQMDFIIGRRPRSRATHIAGGFRRISPYYTKDGEGQFIDHRPLPSVIPFCELPVEYAVCWQTEGKCFSHGATWEDSSNCIIFRCSYGLNTNKVRITGTSLHQCDLSMELRLHPKVPLNWMGHGNRT